MNWTDWIETPESSNIARYRYEINESVLQVEFKNGGTYNYYDVHQEIFDQMKAAASKGQFLAQNVKGAYRYAKV